MMKTIIHINFYLSLIIMNQYEFGECSNGSVANGSQLDNQRLSIIKQIATERFQIKLLNSLGLTKPPKVDNTSSRFDSLPEHIKNEIRQSNQEARQLKQYENNKVEEIILQAKPTQLNKSRAGNIHFSVDNLDGIDPQSVISAKILGERDKNSVADINLELWETRLVGSKLKFVDRKIQTVTVSDNENKISFDLTDVLVHWLMNQNAITSTESTFRFAIVCLHCAQYDVDVPLLSDKTVLEIKHRLLVRKKRAAPEIKYCDKNVTSVPSKCCVYPLLIDLDKIGWDFFVVYPRQIMINSCYGPCQQESHTMNAKLIQAYKHSRYNNLTALKVCCAPTSYSNYTIIFQDEGQCKLVVLHHMIVTGCGCI